MVWSIDGRRSCAYLEYGSGFARINTAYHACALVAALSLAAGCAVDERTLLVGDQDAGSSGSAGSSSGGSGPSFGGGPPAVDLPDCIYSGAVEPGCETLVDNAGFERDVAGWAQEPLAITIGWDEVDAMGSDESGSIAVLNAMHGQKEGLAASGGAQCLAASPGTIYDMAADVFIPQGQGAGFGDGPYVGRAGVSILFWPNDSCSNTERTLTPSYQTNLVEETDVWSRVEGNAVAPDGAVSMSVRVLTVKPFYQYTFKALFDNVLLQER